MHVSSAYANADRAYAEEVLYPAPCDADMVIKLVSSLNDSKLEGVRTTYVNLNTECIFA